MKQLLISMFLAVGLSSPTFAESPPTQEQEDFAREVTDTLTQRLFALLLNEFANTTVDNFQAGNAAISLVFDDNHRNFRLVGENAPISENNLPQDFFEEDALANALQGITVEEVSKSNGKWYVRRSIPLQNFDPSCVICHSNFGSPDNAYVGALMLRVPVNVD